MALPSFDDLVEEPSQTDLDPAGSALPRFEDLVEEPSIEQEAARGQAAFEVLNLPYRLDWGNQPVERAREAQQGLESEGVRLDTRLNPEGTRLQPTVTYRPGSSADQGLNLKIDRALGLIREANAPLLQQAQEERRASESSLAQANTANAGQSAANRIGRFVGDVVGGVVNEGAGEQVRSLFGSPVGLHFQANIGPAATGALTAAAAITPSGQGLATQLAPLAFGFGGSQVGAAAQEMAQQAVETPEVSSARHQALADAPAGAALAGRTLAGATLFRPSIRELRAAFAGNEAARQNVMAGTAIGTGMAGAGALVSGQPITPELMAEGLIGGALMNRPTAIAQAMGFHAVPLGDTGAARTSAGTISEQGSLISPDSPQGTALRALEGPDATTPLAEPAPVAEAVTVTETPKPTAEGIVPAIRVSGEVVPGQSGDTHQDILNRFMEQNPDRAADALVEFDKKENPNFFVDPQGAELSRSQLQENFGVSDSQGLREIQRNLGPGAANIEEMSTAPQPVGAYNAKVDEQRVARGLDPLMSESRKTDQTTWENTERKIESDPAYPERLVSEISAGQKKGVTDEEQTALLWRMIDLRNKRDQADVRAQDEQTYSPEERAEFEAEARMHEEQLQRTEEADRKAGTQQGRALRIRRLLAYEDFTLAGLERKAREAKGGPLTPEERGDLEKLSARSEAAKQKLESRHQELGDDVSVDEAIKEIERQAAQSPGFEPEVLSLASRISARLEKSAESALKRLRGKFAQFGSAPDPTILSDLVIYGSSKIAKGLVKFGQWSASMVREFGDGIRPYLAEAWKGANSSLDAQIEGVAPKSRAGVSEAIKKTKTVATADQIGERMKSMTAEGAKLPELRGMVQKLTETLVRGGIKQRGPLVDAVHAYLQEIDPSITRRQAMDAISGYGDFKPLNKEPIKVEIRDLKGQMQQVAKLEDIEGKRPLQKTGVERRAPSDEERRLIQQVNDAKKKFGVVVTDPETQLKSALDAIETQLQNQIKDLTVRFETGEPARQRTPAPTNERIDSLRGLRDRLRATLDSLRPREPLSDEQRAKIAKRSLESQITDLDERLRTGDIGPRPRSPQVRTAELDALRARRDAMRAELDELASVLKPKATPEERAMLALKKRMASRQAELSERIATEDFGPRPKRTPMDISKDPEAIRARAELDRVKKEFLEKQDNWKRDQRTAVKKFTDAVAEVAASSRTLVTAADLSAAFRQGGFISIGDLLTNPARFKRQSAEMIRSMASEKAFENAEAAIRLRPNADLYESAKLYLSDPDGKFTQREEHMRSNLAEKIPVVKSVVRGSNRAFTSFLNRQRVDAFDAFVEAMGGKDKISPQDAGFLAKAINDMTGRGDVQGSLVGATNFLARYLFSPRYLISRMNLIAGRPIWRGAFNGEGVSLRARAVVAGQYAKFLAGFGALAGLALLSGATISTDRKSSDFMKFRFGDTRIDALTGLQQIAVLASRLGSGQTTDATGKTKKQSRWDSLTRFMRSKMAPLPGAAINYADEKNVVGEPVTGWSTIRDLTLPLSYQDAPDIMRKQGPVKGTVIELLNLLGMGAQDYEPKRKK